MEMCGDIYTYIHIFTRTFFHNRGRTNRGVLLINAGFFGGDVGLFCTDVGLF